jgi:hypothetical protein
LHACACDTHLASVAFVRVTVLWCEGTRQADDGYTCQARRVVTWPDSGKRRSITGSQEHRRHCSYWGEQASGREPTWCHSMRACHGLSCMVIGRWTSSCAAVGRSRRHRYHFSWQQLLATVNMQAEGSDSRSRHWWRSGGSATGTVPQHSISCVDSRDACMHAAFLAGGSDHRAAACASAKAATVHGLHARVLRRHLEHRHARGAHNACAQPRHAHNRAPRGEVQHLCMVCMREARDADVAA